MFQLDKELDQYTALLDGIEFVCEEVQDGYEDEARRLCSLYRGKLPDIIAFMLPGLRQMYGQIDPEQLAKSLGRPTIDLDLCQISYAEQVLDDMHIFSFEYLDDFSEFSNFSIDG